MKKILFLADGLLQQQLGIGKVAAVNLKCLQSIFGEENVDVLVIEHKDQLNNGKYEVLVPYYKKIEKYISLLKGYYNFSEKSEETIIDKIRKNSYEEIFIDNSWYGKLAKRIKKEFPTVKISIFFHDVKRYLARIWLKQRGIHFLKFYFPIIKNEELSLKYSDRFIVLNERENTNLKTYYNRDADAVIPISLEDNYEENDYKKDSDYLKLLFVGADYGPNYRGIKWFIENVFPLIKDLKIELDIVGNGTEKWKCEFEKENIKIHGRVDDLSKHYYNSDLAILPIFEGAGMKVKTAEALMYGKYIVGAKEAFEGYEILKDVGIECNDKVEFEKAIREIYKNKKNNLSIFKCNEASRKLYKEKYSFESALEKYRKLYKM